jgi:collagenase-like PrtC family protease
MILVAASFRAFMFNLVEHVPCNDAVCDLPYRYWPNNKSRMYVLENTGEYLIFKLFIICYIC